MQKQTTFSDVGLSGVITVVGCVAFVRHLIGNDWQITGDDFQHWLIFAYCVYLHFRVADLQKGTDQQQ
jgi:hypothetical protein